MATDSSGYTVFDEKFGVKNGTNLPDWQVLFTSGSYRLDNVNDLAFRGIFALDAEGWVVWYYDSATYTYVFDMDEGLSADDRRIVMLHPHNSNYEFPGNDENNL